MRLVVAAVLAATLAGCGGGSSSVQRDQEFLQLTSQDGLGAVDAVTRVQLGHQACDLLAKHHGDAAAADGELVSGALTADLVASLRADATVAYCPKWR